MTCEETEDTAQPGFDDMVEESGCPETTAEHGETLLTGQMRGLIIRRGLGIPGTCRHTGLRDQLHHPVI